VLNKSKENVEIGEDAKIEKLIGSHVELLRQSQTEWEEAQKKYLEWQQTNAYDINPLVFHFNIVLIDL